MHRIPFPAAILAICLALPACARADTVCGGMAADLRGMAVADQALRTRLDFLAPENPEQAKLRSHLMLVDRANTTRLKAWIARCGWPSRQEHGDQAAGDAWLLVQHADHDLTFQKKALALIEQDNAANGKDADQLFALLWDRVAVAEKRPQRYGTQLASRSSDMCDLEFAPMEARAQVEARRAALRMPPLDDYKRLVLDMQHCPRKGSGDHHYAPPAKPQALKRR